MSIVTFYRFYIIIWPISTIFMHRSVINMATKKLKGLDFEVYGIVQGVFFRKYTQEEARKLGLKGWCRNTNEGTVKGVIEGSEEKINEMKKWLQSKGSPHSRIDKAVFTNEREIADFTFSDFKIQR